jgi:tetratricopeptide (TPR) repeat protein
MSHHDEEDEDVKAHEARDWELIGGDDLDLRIDGLLCIAKRKGEDSDLASESLTFAESAETLLREEGDCVRLFSALRTKADALYVLKRFDEAKDACLEAAGLAVGEMLDHKAGQMFFNAGGCAYNLKHHEEAVALCLKSASFLEAASNPLESGVALAWAGRNYFELGDFVKAIEAYRPAIDLFEAEGALLKVGDCSRLMAKAYIGAGDLHLAEQALLRAEACLEFSPCDETSEKVRFARALLLAAGGKHAQAISVFQGMFDEAKILGSVEFTTKIAFERAKSELAIGQYESAAKTFTQLSLALQGTSSPITKLDCLRQLVRAHELAGNALDQVATIDQILNLPEILEMPAESNLLKLQLGLTLSTLADDTRALAILEALPRTAFEAGSEAWMKHAMGLLQNYDKRGRSSECLFLANELLATADPGHFDELAPEIHFIKASALNRLGHELGTRVEAQIAFDLLTKAAQYERAKEVQAKFLLTEPSEPESVLFVESQLAAKRVESSGLARPA